MSLSSRALVCLASSSIASWRSLGLNCCACAGVADGTPVHWPSRIRAWRTITTTSIFSVFMTTPKIKVLSKRLVIDVQHTGAVLAGEVWNDLHRLCVVDPPVGLRGIRRRRHSRVHDQDARRA